MLFATEPLKYLLQCAGYNGEYECEQGDKSWTHMNIDAFALFEHIDEQETEKTHQQPGTFGAAIHVLWVHQRQAEFFSRFQDKAHLVT